MGLSDVIARLAVRAAQVLVVEVPGHGETRMEVEQELLRRGGTFHMIPVATGTRGDLDAFTALRAWYVPASARSLDDVVAVRATCDHGYQLRELEGPAGKKLARADVVATGLNWRSPKGCSSVTATRHSTC